MMPLIKVKLFGYRVRHSLFNGDASLRLSVLRSDNAAELFGDVSHKSLIKRSAGIELVSRVAEYIVGIAAVSAEVVCDNSVDILLVECLAVNLIDGYTGDLLGSVICRVGISLIVLLILLGSIDRDLHACDLRESADCLRAALA